MRNIYRLNNYTKNECYIGTTKYEVEDRIGEHQVAPGKSLEHWNFSNDQIKWLKLHDKSEFKTEQDAIYKAHQLEKNVVVLILEVVNSM